jgi:acyl-CoA-binding protein
MSDLQAHFEQAAADSKQLATKPDNDTLLTLYALYKQATIGDVQGSRPGMFDLVGRAKYDAWSAIKGTARESAMQSYIDLVNRLKTQSQ